MAAERNEDLAAGRGLLTAALGVLAAVTAAGFSLVFTGAATTARLIVAGLVAVGVAVVTERRSALAWLGASAGALIVVLGILVFPERTFLGFPTPDSVRSMLAALGRVGVASAGHAAPSPPVSPLLLVAVVAMWVAATACHGLLVRSSSPVLSLLPAAALVAFPGTVGLGRPRPGYAVAFLLASLAVLFASAVHGLGRWGRMSSRRSLARGVTARVARRMAVAASVIALAIPGILPGLGGRPLADLRGSGHEFRISPIVDIRPSLNLNPEVTLFHVTAPRPLYWRLLSLDEFDGRVWTADSLRADPGQPLSGSGPLVGAPSVPSTRTDQVFQIDSLAGPWLPAAYHPVAVAVDDTVRFESDHAALSATERVRRGFTYRVQSAVIAPSFRTLDGAYGGWSGRTLGPRFVKLPDNVPPELRSLAERITRDEPTPLRKILAIQSYLRGFTYDQEAPAGHGVNDIIHFLSTRRGYCEQFAGTMAVLVRALGLPARVAVGFLPGTKGSDGRYEVTTADAHAWTEVLFPGYGWIAFEPTPTRSNPAAQTYLTGPSGVGGGPLLRDATGRLTAGSPEAAPSREREQLPSEARAGQRRGRGGIPWVWIVPLALLAAALAVPLQRAAARRLRMGRAHTPREVVLAAYAAFADGAADVGLGRSPGETLEEFGQRLRRADGFEGRDLERITDLAVSALYGRTAPRAKDAAWAVTASRALRRRTRRHAGPARTVTGWFRPRRQEPLRTRS